MSPAGVMDAGTSARCGDSSVTPGARSGTRGEQACSKTSSHGEIFWCISYRTRKQDGSEGRYYYPDSVACPLELCALLDLAGAITAQAAGAGSSGPPEADLTKYLEFVGRLERGCGAQHGWETIRTECWHYHCAVDKQQTFLGECELAGITESACSERATGWTIRTAALVDTGELTGPGQILLARGARGAIPHFAAVFARYSFRARSASASRPDSR